MGPSTLSPRVCFPTVRCGTVGNPGSCHLKRGGGVLRSNVNRGRRDVEVDRNFSRIWKSKPDKVLFYVPNIGGASGGYPQYVSPIPLMPPGARKRGSYGPYLKAAKVFIGLEMTTNPFSFVLVA